MTRVALYARYSSDNQRAASIEDQFRLCEERATREGWQLVDCYRDAAISGASMILRPGIQTLLRDAQAGQFDIVLAEALDRVSRDQADVATLFKRLQFAGVTIVTLGEGEINELHVGLKGTMNALFLKDLAMKTHRGLRGRVEAGKSGGGLCYGYRVVHQMDARGELIRGEREIDPVQAEIVRRIFHEFASGRSALAIASRLNDEGIPSPTGGKWNNTTLRGNALRGTGIVNNELYIGRLVWNRLRYLKDPQTGKRVSRLNPQSEWIITDVPELRIMDDDLWQAVRDRQALIAEKSVNISAGIRASINKLNGQRRPKSLLSGLVFCGVCGGPCSIRGGDRFACSTHMDNRSCTNRTTIRRPELEDRVLSGLKDRLMTPEAAAEAMRAYVEETNRANHERRASTAGWQTELTRLRKGLKQMLQVIEDGGYTRGMVERMREMEAREDELVALLAAQPQDVPDIHPNVAGIFKHKVERLAETLNHPEDRQEASEAIRALIEKIVLHPGKGRGEMHATLHGELGTLLDFAASGGQGSRNANTPGARASGVSVSGIAGARNRHPWGTENRLVQFERSFIELITVGDVSAIPEHGPRHFSFGAFVRDYLRRQEGIAMLVLDSADAKADAALFDLAGVGSFDPFFFERKGRRPDGREVHVAFTLAFAAEPEAHDAGFFVCQQHFPENFWNPTFQRHENGATGLCAIGMTAARPEDHASFLGSYSGASPRSEGDNGFSVALNGGTLNVRPGTSGEKTLRLTSVSTVVPDLSAQARRLKEAAIRFKAGERALHVCKDVAFGTELVFRESDAS